MNVKTNLAIVAAFCTVILSCGTSQNPKHEERGSRETVKKADDSPLRDGDPIAKLKGRLIVHLSDHELKASEYHPGEDEVVSHGKIYTPIRGTMDGAKSKVPVGQGDCSIGRVASLSDKNKWVILKKNTRVKIEYLDIFPGSVAFNVPAGNQFLSCHPGSGKSLTYVKDLKEILEGFATFE